VWVFFNYLNLLSPAIAQGVQLNPAIFLPASGFWLVSVEAIPKNQKG